MKTTPIIEADGTRKGGIPIRGGPRVIGYSQDLSDEEYERKYGQYLDSRWLDATDEGPKKGHHYIMHLIDGSGLYNDGTIYDYKGIKKLMKKYDLLENNYRIYEIE